MMRHSLSHSRLRLRRSASTCGSPLTPMRHFCSSERRPQGQRTSTSNMHGTAGHGVPGWHGAWQVCSQNSRFLPQTCPQPRCSTSSVVQGGSWQSRWQKCPQGSGLPQTRLQKTFSR